MFDVVRDLRDIKNHQLNRILNPLVCTRHQPGGIKNDHLDPTLVQRIPTHNRNASINHHLTPSKNRKSL
jgi:hypothetical protein